MVIGTLTPPGNARFFLLVLEILGKCFFSGDYIKKMKYDRNILSERMIQTRGKHSQGDMARRLGITQAYLS